MGLDGEHQVEHHGREGSRHVECDSSHGKPKEYNAATAAAAKAAHTPGVSDPLRSATRAVARTALGPHCSFWTCAGGPCHCANACTTSFEHRFHRTSHLSMESFRADGHLWDAAK